MKRLRPLFRELSDFPEKLESPGKLGLACRPIELDQALNLRVEAFRDAKGEFNSLILRTRMVRRIGQQPMTGDRIPRAQRTRLSGGSVTQRNDGAAGHVGEFVPASRGGVLQGDDNI